ncbi:MAG: hypothetical protein P1Q69_18135 [Candidatus Thorarchaeota archaeon]|nr:hypothetical protein [Candidatus Thorarchaeota archaeon]
MYYGTKQLLSLLSIFVLLIGPTLVMVDAAYVPSSMVTHTQSFDRAENNHTYVYTDSADLSWYDTQFLFHKEDVTYTPYWYEKAGWQTATQSYAGPAEREFLFDDGYTGV